MKRLYFIFSLAFVLPGCDKSSENAETAPAVSAPPPAVVEQTVPVATLEVSNPSEFARPNTLVRLSLNEIGVSDGPLQVWQGDTALPTQLVDDDGDETPDRLMFLTDLGTAASHDYVIDR